MPEMECYVLMNIDTTRTLGYLSERLWEKEGIRLYEIEGPMDAYVYYSGTFDDVKKFGERIRKTKGVRAAETYLVRDSVRGKPTTLGPSALISGHAQPRFGSDDHPIDIMEVLIALSKYPHLIRISAILGGIDLLGELSGSLDGWHVARRALLNQLPSYITIETHRVISFDSSDRSDSGSLGHKDQAKLKGSDQRRTT